MNSQGRKLPKIMPKSVILPPLMALDIYHKMLEWK